MLTETTPLTPRQQEIYGYILNRILAGDPPTIREIMTEFGTRSPNGIVFHLDSMTAKGYLLQGAQRARGLKLGPTALQELRRQRVKVDGDEVVLTFTEPPVRVRLGVAEARGLLTRLVELLA